MKSLSNDRVSDRFCALVVAGLIAASGPAQAGEGALGPDEDGQDTIIVVGVTPVQGAGLPADQVPSNVQTLSSAVIQADHAETVTDLVERHLSSVSLADTEGSPFQQDLVERGYTASPVLGTPQGLAIYQNGVRLNEPFGDAVLWDFVPVFAIDTLQELPGSNPVFGLNALGGAVTLQMKNGFDAEGATLDLAGGSFGRIRAIAQLGLDFGDTAVYLGSLATHEDGWRQLSPSDLVQEFGDVAVRRDGYTLGASLTLAAANLNGNGADPAEDDRRAAFAVPDSERDRLVFLQTRERPR